MASLLTLNPYKFCNSNVFRADDRVKCGLNDAPYALQISAKEQDKHSITRTIPFRGFWLTCSVLSKNGSRKWIPHAALSSMPSDADSGEKILPGGPFLPESRNCESEFTRVDCLVRVMHESARNFSLDVQALEFVRPGPELAMAWVGVDVHAWHKHISYQVATYAMLKAAIEVELFLAQKRCNNPSPIQEILSPKVNFLGERLESQLNTKNPKLLQWFRMVELPQIEGLFIPLFKKWSLDYSGSGVAGIMAISCCAAIQKLGSRRISSSLFSVSVEDALLELMSSADGLVSIEKLHQFATEAGFEEEFLRHFGGKVLPTENVENLEFWIGLVQKKLSAAFDRENVLEKKLTFDDKVSVYDSLISLAQVSKKQKVLATLGLFAYLGRETRLFFSTMSIKDLDEQTKDFLCYLECGNLFIYPEFSTLSKNQLFMEVVADEIGWLDLYATFTCKFYPDRENSKQHAVQVEKEIILYTAFTVCYDVISGFAHYTNSKQQSLSTNLLEFLLQSQNLLSTCLEDFWDAYGGTGGWPTSTEREAFFSVDNTARSCLVLEAQEKRNDLIKGGKQQYESTLNDAVNLGELGHSPASKPFLGNLLEKSTDKLVSSSTAVLMGTQLLFIDISETSRIVVKQIRGWKITKRERKKMKTTLNDIATLVPITILMLLPVSAIGHAAMLAGIKKYMPHLIPSPYSTERRSFVKQVKRTKKMEIQPLISAENVSNRVV